MKEPTVLLLLLLLQILQLLKNRCEGDGITGEILLFRLCYQFTAVEFNSCMKF